VRENRTDERRGEIKMREFFMEKFSLLSILVFFSERLNQKK
jgi:hypothetical protein